MSVESCKGGEINSQQAEAITTIAATNEYKGKSRITTLLELPWGRKWNYFRDQLLARTATTVVIVCVVIYIAIQVLTPAATPKPKCSPAWPTASSAFTTTPSASRRAASKASLASIHCQPSSAI